MGLSILYKVATKIKQHSKLYYFTKQKNSGVLVFLEAKNNLGSCI